MKKILTITLLVLLTVGLFVACNADAVSTLFEEENCFICIDDTASPCTSYLVIVKDSESNWWCIMASKSGDDIYGSHIELTKSGDNLYREDEDDCITFEFSLSSRILTETQNGSPIKDLYLNPATITQPFVNTNTPGATVLICQYDGATYEFKVMFPG